MTVLHGRPERGVCGLCGSVFAIFIHAEAEEQDVTSRASTRATFEDICGLFSNTKSLISSV